MPILLPKSAHKTITVGNPISFLSRVEKMGPQNKGTPQICCQYSDKQSFGPKGKNE